MKEKASDELYEVFVLNGIVWLELIETGQLKDYSQDFFKKAIYGESQPAQNDCFLCTYFKNIHAKFGYPAPLNRCDYCALTPCRRCYSAYRRWLNSITNKNRDHELARIYARDVYEQMMYWFENNYYI